MNQIRRITEEERRQKNINVSELYNENLLLKTELARVRGLLQRITEIVTGDACADCKFKLWQGTAELVAAESADIGINKEELCIDCGQELNNPRYHFEAPGNNWGAALHHFRKKGEAK